LLVEFWKKYTPEIFATAEGENFAEYVEQRSFNVPYLYDILNLEKAILDVRINGGTKKVHFQYDPRPILRNLIERKLSKHNLLQKDFEIEVNPDKIILLSEGLLEDSISI
jgi:hypothetical protein